MSLDRARSARARASAVAVLVGLALVALAHLVGCGTAGDGHGRPHTPGAAAAAPTAYSEAASDACPALHDADGHHSTGHTCCAAADCLTEPRSRSAAAPLVALLCLLAALGAAVRNQGGAGGCRPTAASLPAPLAGVSLLRLACVSRT